MPQYETTVTSKGQVTIPARLRASWMLKEGDKIEFYSDDSGRVLVRPLNAAPTAVFDEFAPETMPNALPSDDEAIAQAIANKEARSRKQRSKE
ncbi:MAG: AbrB/MazE/SpoVT family DNA-binding domain-containing protein [Rhodomicrobium sp.]